MSKKIKCATLLKRSRLHILTLSLIFIALFFPFSKGGSETGAGLAVHYVENTEEKNDISEDSLLIFHENTVIPRSQLRIKETNIVGEVLATKEGDGSSPERVEVIDVINTTITGYSSTVDQTNCEPFITASGVRVRDGIIAANFLPFDTEVRIPEYFGEKVFIVKDRMNRRHTDRVDIWFPSRQEALNFGIKYTYIEIVETY